MIETELNDVAKTVRSKNAGVDHITFDIIFIDRSVYNYIKEQQLITKRYVAELYDISEDRIEVFRYFDPAKAAKITMKRSRSSGDPGENDVYGAQQYAPLLNLTLSLPERVAVDD